MAVTITSTTDTPEAVIAATGSLAKESVVEENKSAPESTEKSQLSDENIEDSETSESNDEEDQSDSQDDEGLKDETKDDDQKPKKKNGFKKKIGKLQSELSTTRQEIERLRQEVAAKSEGQKEKATTQPDDKPKADNFDTHEDYIDALTDWKINQREANAKQKVETETAKTQYETSLKSHQERVDAFKKSDEGAGFQKAVDSFMEEYGEPEFSLVMTNLIVGSDLGPAVVYELAKNKAEFDRINALPPLQAAVEFGKLEAKVSKSSSSKQETKKITTAPAPLKTVGSKSSGSAGKSPEDMNFQEYKKWREANT